MEEVTQFELTKEFLEKFECLLEERDAKSILKSLEGINSADITSLLYEFDTEECIYIVDILEDKVSAEILKDLDDDIRSRFLQEISVSEVARYVEHLDSDDGADLLKQIPLKLQEQVIGMLKSDEKAGYLLDLMQYDEDVAGGLMAKELIKANINWTVSQCIEEIRKQAENVSKIYSVYVVDDLDKLHGKISLKKMLLATDQTKISDIYDLDIVSVETYLEELEVAQIMQKYDLDAIPVVNARGKLVGRITIDDVLDVVTELAEEERQMMSGISSDVEEDDSVWALSKARLPWLFVGIMGGLLGAYFISFYEEDLKVVPMMAFFVPLITATGGNVGIQSSSLVVQSLANRNAFKDSLLSRLVKVLFVAVVNGIILAIIVFGIVILSKSDQNIAMTVSIALFSVVLLASFMGTITPLILDKFGINPALASGPFITTANDLMGLVVYFSVAHALY